MANVAPDLIARVEASGTDDWAENPHVERHLWVRLRQSPEFLTGVLILAFFVGVAIFAIAAYGANDFTLPLQVAFSPPLFPAAPSPAFPFGVIWIYVFGSTSSSVPTWYGFDLLDALVRATPVDLALIGGTIGLAATIGVLLGARAGFGSHAYDVAIVNAAYVIVGVPPFFFALILFAGLAPYLAPAQLLPVFGILFALVLWPYYAIPVRARARQVATEPFVEASRAAGASPRRLLFRHILPNSFGPVFAQAPIDVYNIFFVLTIFPWISCTNPYFFGFASPLPTQPYPEWGYLLASGACNADSNILANFGDWWMYAFPALTLILFGLGVALLCDGATQFMRSGRVGR